MKVEKWYCDGCDIEIRTMSDRNIVSKFNMDDCSNNIGPYDLCDTCREKFYKNLDPKKWVRADNVKELSNAAVESKYRI